jgi:hypothetical protein
VTDQPSSQLSTSYSLLAVLLYSLLVFVLGVFCGWAWCLLDQIGKRLERVVEILRGMTKMTKGVGK